MPKLQEILNSLEEVAQSGAIGPEGAAGVEAGVLLTQIAMKVVAMHKAATGEPMDLSQLHQIQND